MEFLTGFFILTLCARPIGKAFILEDTFAGIALAQTQNPPSPSKISPILRSCLAVATASPFHTSEEPVGSFLSTGERILVFVSNPIK